MNIQRTAVIRRSLAVLMVASIAAGAPTVWSQSTDAVAPAAQDKAAARQAHMRQHLQTRLDRMAERLQIMPAQQGAWTSYVNAVQGLVGTKLAKPAAEADAASIARLRAERAAEHARKLAQLADATDSLQRELDAEQQRTLGEIVRHAGRGMRHGRNRSL